MLKMIIFVHVHLYHLPIITDFRSMQRMLSMVLRKFIVFVGLNFACCCYMMYTCCYMLYTCCYMLYTCCYMLYTCCYML